MNIIQKEDTISTRIISIIPSNTIDMSTNTSSDEDNISLE